jgi:hypothetical protein
MEQPCHKCGQAVEEGVPFCPHCSAPQIRVVVAEAVPAVSVDLAVTAPGNVLPTSPSVALDLPVRLSDTLKPCALAALVASLLMSLGLNPFVAMISVGFLAVVFYRQRQPGTAMRMAMGARLGAVSGLLWFAIASVLEALVVLFLHKGPEIRNELITRIGQAASQTTDPQALALFDKLQTPAGIEVLMLFGVIFAFIASILLASLGGLLGSAILGRSRRS